MYNILIYLQSISIKVSQSVSCPQIFCQHETHPPAFDHRSTSGEEWSMKLFTIKIYYISPLPPLLSPESCPQHFVLIHIPPLGWQTKFGTKQGMIQGEVTFSLTRTDWTCLMHSLDIM
jgi:hypothetical protein